MKKYIEQVLGNSLRCILPSYWWKSILGKMADRIESVGKSVDDKQAKLISGTNIKTINGSSILGSGNITVATETSTPYVHRLYVKSDGSSYYNSYNSNFYSLIKNGGNYTTNPRKAFIIDSSNVYHEVAILSASYSSANGCRVLLGGFDDNTFDYNYECVITSDGYSSATVVAGGGVADEELSEISENPIQNKVVTQALLDTELIFAAALSDLEAKITDMKNSIKVFKVWFSETVQLTEGQINDNKDCYWRIINGNTVDKVVKIDENGFITNTPIIVTGVENDEVLIHAIQINLDESNIVSVEKSLLILTEDGTVRYGQQ